MNNSCSPNSFDQSEEIRVFFSHALDEHLIGVVAHLRLRANALLHSKRIIPSFFLATVVAFVSFYFASVP